MWPSGKIHFFIFIAIVVILLLNLLIAMMGDTYAKIAEIKNEWMRQVKSPGEREFLPCSGRAPC
jgi:hypothetical protein